MSRPRFTVYEADRSGECWDILQSDSPAEVLGCLLIGRAARPDNAFGVYLTDDPEVGDVEDMIGEPCEYCGQEGHWGGCKAQERHDNRCL
jgi:hypothetical protein